MLLMIIVALVIFGLCLGSFVNALVWRLHEQDHSADKKKLSQKYLDQLSITKGRSMCPHCRHELAAKDLVPVFSWLVLRGKCRNCAKPISVQYPLIEIATALLFVASYIWWPVSLDGINIAIFGFWLVLLTGLMALLVYDLHWMLLPNRIVYPLGAVAAVQAILSVIWSDEPLSVLLNLIGSVIVGGGLFYLLYQLSGGKWIGGGDVKLGWLLGLIVGTPARSLLCIFIAAILGSLVSLPMLAGGKLKRNSTIPFGPFLIAGAIIVELLGGSILHWYKSLY